MNPARGTLYQAVHAVQRVGERTVVYWSLGWLEEPELVQFSSFGRRPFSSTVPDAYGSAPFVNIALPDQGLYLYAVPDPSHDDMRASTSRLDAIPD